MSGRPAASRVARPEVLGSMVADLRRLGVPWKTIEDMFGRERTQLWRVLRRAEMQQNRRAMQHRGDCEAPVIR